MKKYELIKDDFIQVNNHKLYRIKALIDFADVKAGELGGYIQKEENLSHEKNAWVRDDARVYGRAKISGNACVYNNVKVSGNAWIYGDAKVYGNAKISDTASVHGNAEVYGNAEIYGIARVCGNAKVYDNARVSAKVLDDACVYGNAHIYDCAHVYGTARIYDNANVFGDAKVFGNTWIYGNAEIRGNAIIKSNDDYIVFKNSWSSGRYFTYTRSNQMWKVGCFYGTGEELIQKAYKDSEKSGKNYELYVNLVKEMERIENQCQ